MNRDYTNEKRKNMIKYPEEVERIAQELRYERFDLLINNCIIKSIRFRNKCRLLGIPARANISFSKARTKWFGYRLVLPTIHGFGELDGERIEVAHRLDQIGVWGTVDADVIPVFTMRI